ncbi:hypothetical protein BJX70DRAFT_361826 [Aspergillus crustosus]
MATPTNQPPHFEPFALLTENLLILPTPLAVSIKPYRQMYASVHANRDFCNMGFGPHFLPRVWSDDETREVIQARDIGRCWNPRGMGDFAVGKYENLSDASQEYGRVLGSEDGKEGGVRLVEGDEYESLISAADNFLDKITWVGYAGVRDATTTSMPARTPEDAELPPWKEMVELRYGVAQEYWGKGVAREAAKAVMEWAAKERGVRRFIAETEKENVRSGRVLQKMGFVLSGTDYWKEPSEMEWERVVG